MRRRDFFAAALSSAADRRTVNVPIHRIVDARARCSAETLGRFWGTVWPQALIELGRSGISLVVEDGPGEMRRTAGDRPIFLGLKRGMLNVVLTDYIPMNWDSGRALAGVTLVYDGYPLSLIAMRFAHANQFPFFSVNTVVHELMHAFFGDIFVARPKWYRSGTGEGRADAYSTRLWLFHDGAAVRDAARGFVDRVERGAPRARVRVITRTP